MIKPATLWALFKSCDNSQWLGDLCRALGKQKVDLDYSQQQLLNVITTDSGWMDERIEAQREKWRERQREKRERDKSDNRDNGDKSQCHGCHDTSVPPSVHPSVPPKEDINRSVDVPLGGRTDGTERNANGTGVELLIPAGISQAHKLATRFAGIVNSSGSDGGEAFFDGRFDAVTICLAITGDFESARRWRQMVNEKGDAAVRETAFAFWREIQSGEDVDNRGAALNARLGKLKDAKEGE